MRGRKPTPAILAELRNNTHRPPRPEPQAFGNLADPPDHFTPSQCDAWNYAIRHAPPGMLKLIDRSVLETWVVAADLHRQAVIAQSKAGLIIRAPNTGVPIQSPYLPIINRQALIMLKAASELGFSPVSRPRVFSGAPAPGEGLNDPSNQSGDLQSYLDAAPDPTALN